MPAPTPRRTAEWTIAAGLGALTVTGYAPFGFYPLPLLTFAGLFLLWQRATDARAAALTGFAFGLGLTRFVMMHFGIDDIRLMNSGDQRFLSQF